MDPNRRALPVSRLCLCAVLAVCGGKLFAQTAVEQPNREDHRDFPAVWPKGPDRESVPAWAAPGRIRFARWDGGRIEVAKAVLSGWPGFCPPDPDLLYTMANWYDPGTIRFAKEAGLNVLWVTFSVGFSNETERDHQEQVRRYILECHRQGIHVVAYESIANIFWEDMFAVHPEAANWPSIGKDGKPVPYGAAYFAKVGRITRYMADLTKPQWRDYLRRRVDLAIDAGADGITYDNNFGRCLAEVYSELQQHAASRKKDFLMMGNFHADTYVVNRLLNSLTTEDGVEPGLYTAPPPEPSRGLTPLKSGSLATNIGLLRIHESLSEGWKPAMIECGRRETGNRFLGMMSPQRTQLAMAESMMYGVAHELFVEVKVARQLVTGDPAATEAWRAAGAYNRFFANHEDLYVGARSKCDIAVVLDDAAPNLPLLNRLAAHGVLYNVVYDRDLTAAMLHRYKAALVVAQDVPSSAQSAIAQFSAKGGKVFVIECGNKNQQTLLENATRFHANASIELLAAELTRATGEPLVTLQSPDGVLYNVTEQPQRRRLLVHLLNYTLQPAEKICLTVRGRFKPCDVLSPDATAKSPLRVSESHGRTEVDIPSLGIYAVLVFESL